MTSLDRCPCGGALFRETDEHGTRVTCFSCGRDPVTPTITQAEAEYEVGRMGRQRRREPSHGGVKL